MADIKKRKQSFAKFDIPNVTLDEVSKEHKHKMKEKLCDIFLTLDTDSSKLLHKIEKHGTYYTIVIVHDKLTPSEFRPLASLCDDHMVILASDSRCKISMDIYFDTL